MNSAKHLVFTVTTDLVFDQRMMRICRSLAGAGYRVTLLGRRSRQSVALNQEPYRQVRLRTWFGKGFAFYAEYNIRLFLWLLWARVDLICAIDLDSILPCYLVSRLRGKQRVYDAHELFCEMQEIVARPRIYRVWKRIERMTVPHFPLGYTVNQPIADEFRRMYDVNYAVIRNIPRLEPVAIPEKQERYILYQGGVNVGRSFDTLIPAMQTVNARLLIAGDGNYLSQVKALVEKYQLGEKVQFLGRIQPAELKEITRKAWIGLTLFEPTGKSNYFSLANRYFDYLHAAVPQLCVDYPVYRELNNLEPVALLTHDLSPAALSNGLNRLLTDEELYLSLQANCLTQRERLNWQEEEKLLLKLYSNWIKP